MITAFGKPRTKGFRIKQSTTLDETGFPLNYHCWFTPRFRPERVCYWPYLHRISSNLRFWLSDGQNGGLSVACECLETTELLLNGGFVFKLAVTCCRQSTAGQSGFRRTEETTEEETGLYRCLAMQNPWV